MTKLMVTQTRPNIILTKKAQRLPIKPTKLGNVQEWFGKRHVSTVHWQKPWAMAKALKRICEIDSKYPKGTYFKIV